MKVSIVLPVYNVAPFLPQCLDSLTQQTLTDIEVIAVNDGSTDSSGLILNDYSKKDSRIKMIEKENKGLGFARNTGLEYATGEYIGFVDSDDWVDPAMYEILYRKARETNSDFVLCNYVREYPSGAAKNIRSEADFNKIYSKDDIINEFCTRFFGIGSSDYHHLTLDSNNNVWKYLYKADLIKKDGIQFLNERVYFTEDLLFNIHAAFKSSGFAAVDEYLYHYRCNETSLSSKFRPNMFEMKLNTFEYLKEFIKRNSFPEDCFKRLYNRISLETPHIILNYLKSYTLSYPDRMQKVKEICNHPVIQNAFYQTDLKFGPFSKMGILKNLVLKKHYLSIYNLLTLYGMKMKFL